MQPKSWTLLAVCLATFVLLLDITIVNVALPDISQELDASFSDVQWVVDAYALTLAALLPGFLVAAVVAFAGAALVLALVQRSDFVAPGGPTPAQAPEPAAAA